MAFQASPKNLSKYQERTSKEKYRDIFQRLRQSVRNNSRFKAAVYEIHVALHDEPDITEPVPKEAYDQLIRFYQDGKYKGMKCLDLFYYIIADAHYQYAQYSNTPQMLNKAREMYSKSIQAGWKFSDDSRDVFFVNQIALYYSETSKNSTEEREWFLRDVEKMIKSCSYAKGPSACICYFYQGLMWWHHKKPDEALTSFRNSLKLIENTDEDFEEYLIRHRIMNNIGICHQELNNYRLALKIFDKVIAQYDQNKPNSLKEGLKALYQRSLSEKMLGDVDKANSTLLAFINFLETNKLAAHLKRTEEFQQYLEVAKDITHTLQSEIRIPEKKSVEKKLSGDNLKKYNVTKGLITTACDFIEQRQFGRALSVLENVHKVKLEIFNERLPRHDFKGIHTLKAFCLMSLEKYQEAIENYTVAQDVLLKEASTLDADKTCLRRTTDCLARCYEKLGYYEESLHFYKQVIELDTGHMNDDAALANMKIGNVQLQLGDYEQALLSFQNFFKIRKSDELSSESEIINRCYIQIVKTCIKLAMHQKALDYAERGLKYIKGQRNLFADWTYVYKELMGQCWLGLNNPQTALECFTDANYLSDEALQMALPSRYIPSTATVLKCRNRMYQVMCKMRIYQNLNHPDLIEIFEQCCLAGPENINRAFTFNNVFDFAQNSDQEMTRCFLEFMNGCVKQFPRRFSEQMEIVRTFRSSALISDFFRHVRLNK